MKNLLILLSLVALASCGSWGSYMATGVNKYGTRYVVTHEGDTIFREEPRSGGYNTWGPWGSPYIQNPYWNNNVWGPRIIIRNKPKKRNNVNTNNNTGGHGRTPGVVTRPRGAGNKH